jgi:uncharacterized protein YndB with AHSA1/START domain
MTLRKSARKTLKKRARKTVSTAKRALSKATKRLREVGHKAADVSEAAVEKATGKGWHEWFELLDNAGAKAMDHRAIVAVVAKARGVSSWWQQMISVAYERARGLRKKHETTTGFVANVSKTVTAPLATLYNAWVDEERQRAWLGVPAPVVRTANKERSLRLNWHDGSRVNVGFADKGKGKSQVSLGHERLPNARAVTQYKKFWKDALARLQSVLEQQ